MQGFYGTIYKESVTNNTEKRQDSNRFLLAFRPLSHPILVTRSLDKVSKQMFRPFDKCKAGLR
jgi:hypothetical protein